MSSTETGPPADGTGPLRVPLARGKLGAAEVAEIPSPRSARHGRPTVHATGPIAVPDAVLAAGAATSATAFAAIYRRYGDALHAFCLGMLRDPDAAADCVHDVFVTAATRLGQLREHDKLRPWLYAIARHEALRRLRHGRREQPADELPDTHDLADAPEQRASRRELAELVAAASAGLSDRERAVFELHYRHDLDGPALADALGVSATNANTLVGRLRGTVERSLGALLVARHHRERCPGLAVVLDGWDGTLTVLIRKRIARHIDGCDGCRQARDSLVNPRALLASAPVAAPAPDWLSEHVLRETAPLVSGPAPTGAGAVAAASWWPAGLGAGTKTLVAVLAPAAAAAVAVPVALVGLLGGGATTSSPTPLADASVAAAAPALPTTSSSRGRFAVAPSTTRLAPTAPQAPNAPGAAAPPPAPGMPPGSRPGLGTAPRIPGGAPTSGPPARNGIGVPVRPRRTLPPDHQQDQDHDPRTVRPQHPKHHDPGSPPVTVTTPPPAPGN